MSRIRTIKPDFFRHEVLYEAEIKSGLPLRVAFAALWTVADREGRFQWRPRALKLDCLPYDDVDFTAVLDALVLRGFIVRYEVDGEQYGCIPTFCKHQVVNPRERASALPAPSDAHLTGEARVDDGSATRQHPAHGELEGEQEKEKEKEKEGEREAPPAADPPPPTDEVKPKKLANPPKRLSDDWQVGDAECAYATEQGLTPAQIDYQAAKFKDHWLQATRNAVKKDWLAAWRTWIRTEIEWRKGVENLPTAVLFSPAAEFTKVFVGVIDQNWRNWDKYHLATTGRHAPQDDFHVPPPHGPLKRGWYFDSEFPPDHDEQALPKAA